MKTKAIFILYLVMCFSMQINAKCLQGNCINGKGVYKFNNGDLYIGSFKRMVPSGVGIMHYSNGQMREGIWKEGEFELAIKNKTDSLMLRSLRKIGKSFFDNVKTHEVPQYLEEKTKVKKDTGNSWSWAKIIAIITGISIIIGVIEKVLNIRERVKNFNK